MKNFIGRFLIIFNLFFAFNILGSNNTEDHIYINYTCNGTDTNCYPGVYGVPFLDLVSLLNVTGAFINTSTSWIALRMVKSHQKDISEYIKNNYPEISKQGKNLIKSLALITQKFENGINSTNDYFAIQGMIESLNGRKCKGCIEKFVEIVAKNNSNLRPEEFDVLLEHLKNEKCYGHQFEQILDESSYTSENKTCFKYLPSHPCSSFYWIVNGLCFIVTGGITYIIDINDTSKNFKSGSFWGDWCNMSNVFGYSLAAVITVANSYLSKDGIKTSKLSDKINKFISLNTGIIEIYAEVVGKIPNNINYEQAKSLIKSLITVGWPKDLVENFVQICSKKGNIDFSEIKDLLKDIVNIYNEKKIIYIDDDIEYVINYKEYPNFWQGDNLLNEEKEIEIPINNEDSSDEYFEIPNDENLNPNNAKSSEDSNDEQHQEDSSLYSIHESSSGPRDYYFKN